MRKDMMINDFFSQNDEDSKSKAYYSRLFRKFIWLTLIGSLVPLLLVGWLINIHYTGFAKSRMIEHFQTQVEYHKKIIELFLQERISKLKLIAQTHSIEYLKEMPNLLYVFNMMNDGNRSVTDLGLIDENGRHLSYIGPYDLLDKNYAQADWFGQVMKQGLYVSDMFMGFRKEPHFIMAVTRSENGKRWILRATIDTEFFRSLVENVKIGNTGEVFLLNREGVFQTSPRFSGEIMGKSPFYIEDVHAGTKIHILDDNDNGLNTISRRHIIAQAWLSDPPWILVVRQDYYEAFDAVNHANYATLAFLHLSALAILIVSILITRYMIKIIRKRDLEVNQLNRQLLQTSKLASIGELSAGVAHEINNPLAIILTERCILLDLAAQLPDLEEEFKEQLTRSLSQIGTQVYRCKHITHNLLRFSRRTRSVIETVYINLFLREIVELMEREAKSSGIRFITDMDEAIPPILSDPSQLQQLFLNMITNAIDAHYAKPYGNIRISTKPDKQGNGLEILLEDTGMGISPENLDKIFDPFFTTKPAGPPPGLEDSLENEWVCPYKKTMGTIF